MSQHKNLTNPPFNGNSGKVTTPTPDANGKGSKMGPFPDDVYSPTPDDGRSGVYVATPDNQKPSSGSSTYGPPED